MREQHFSRRLNNYDGVDKQNEKRKSEVKDEGQASNTDNIYQLAAATTNLQQQIRFEGLRLSTQCNYENYLYVNVMSKRQDYTGEAKCSKEAKIIHLLHVALT